MDPSGTFVQCDARAIGSASEGAQSSLQEVYHKVIKCSYNFHFIIILKSRYNLHTIKCIDLRVKFHEFSQLHTLVTTT